MQNASIVKDNKLKWRWHLSVKGNYQSSTMGIEP